MKFSRLFPFYVFAAGIFFYSGVSLSASFEGQIIEKDVTVPLSAFPNMDTENKEAIGADLFPKSNNELKKLAPEDYTENTSTIYIKGKYFRVDTENDGQKVSIIYDTNSHKMTTLQWAVKKAMVTSMDEINKQMKNMMQQAPQAMPGKKAEQNFSMNATGKTKMINGYKCELYEGTDSNGNYTHIWLDKGNGALFNSLLPIFTAMQDMSGEEGEGKKEAAFYQLHKGLPIFTQTVTEHNIQIEETMSIKNQPVSDDLFMIPTGFKEVNIQQMMEEQMQQYQEQMKQFQEQHNK